MGLLKFCEWLSHTSWSVSLREGTYDYPVLLIVHVLSICVIWRDGGYRQFARTGRGNARRTRFASDRTISPLEMGWDSLCCCLPELCSAFPIRLNVAVT